MPKKARQQQLVQIIEENPFITDQELTRRLKVSIQTIRLDRMELGIPELRERMKLMAERSYDQVRSLPLHEVIGEIVDLQLDKSGISIFEIREEHVFPGPASPAAIMYSPRPIPWPSPSSMTKSR
ncbi:hypothetical protein HMSSN036_71510 [Paenibacillus macerans]|nr:hypothetical protein HMSSN036_71510 [Paenibacillus macerans]